MVRAALRPFALIVAVLVVAAACIHGDGLDPEIIVEGVGEGAESTSPLTITYSASDDTDTNPSVSAKLDGEAFASGDEVIDVGEYVLVVTAKGVSGKQAEKTISFKIVPPPPDGIAVVLTEWSITGEEGKSLKPLPGGEARFDVRNDGGTVHALAIYRGGDPLGDTIDGGTLLAQTKNIQAGETARLQELLEPGYYWLVCPITGHTAAGMSAQLTVHAP